LNVRKVWINGAQHIGMLGIYGKHPAFGDFISHGVSPRFQAAIEPWVGQILGEVRDHLGDSWQSVYDNALPLRFWLGARVFGESNLRGVILFGHDKVGRRYPLIIAHEANGLPAPVLDHGQDFYDTAQSGLERAFLETELDPATLIAALGDDNSTAAPTEPEPATLWAANPDPQVEELLKAVCATDHQRAAEYRSYWWRTGQQTSASTFLATQGMPDAAEFAWLLAGLQTQALQHPDPSHTDAQSM